MEIIHGLYVEAQKLQDVFSSLAVNSSRIVIQAIHSRQEEQSLGSKAPKAIQKSEHITDDTTILLALYNCHHA
jgi:hypothetical protein